MREKGSLVRGTNSSENWKDEPIGNIQALLLPRETLR